MYKHILTAVDLTAESTQLINKAIALQKLNSSHLSLVYVLEPYSYMYGEIANVVVEFQQKHLAESKLKLNKIAEDNHLTNVSCATLSGHATSEIHQYADDHGVDLIITGSHGRHGVKLLLGSTANGILHGANCDVLAVRIQE